MAHLRIISTVFLLLWLNSPALAVFYRNIPFRLKSNNDEVAVSSGEQGKYGHESIREILDQIEDEAQLIAGERNAAAEPAAAPRRIVRLIPIRSNELDELEVLGEDKENMMAAKGRKKVPTASLNSHLMALRPDYAFRNVANFLRSFFDSRIERHSRRLDGQQNSS